MPLLEFMFEEYDSSCLKDSCKFTIDFSLLDNKFLIFEILLSLPYSSVKSLYGSSKFLSKIAKNKFKRTRLPMIYQDTKNGIDEPYPTVLIWSYIILFQPSPMRITNIVVKPYKKLLKFVLGNINE